MDLKDFEVIIASLPDRENLVAEIYYQGSQWIEISQEINDEMIIQFYSHPDQRYWEFPLEGALSALEHAKHQLLQMGSTKNMSRKLQNSGRAYRRGDTNWCDTGIVECKTKSKYILWIRFDDGVEGDVDLSNLVQHGICKAWESETFWQSVRIDPESGTVCWKQEIDLDPYALKEILLKLRTQIDPVFPQVYTGATSKTPKGLN